jgi:hypothetical protein
MGDGALSAAADLNTCLIVADEPKDHLKETPWE